MQYRVGRDGSELGSFSADELREGLQSGKFLASDLVWKPGMQQWLPIEEALAWMSGARVIEGTVVPETAGASNAGTGVNVGGYCYSFGQGAGGGAAGGHVGVGVMPVPGTAIASLVMGLLPLVVCGIGVILWLPGVICGHMALATIRAPGSRYEGRGMAMAGLILNYFWLLVTALVILFFVFVFSMTAGGTSSSSSSFGG